MSLIGKSKGIEKRMECVWVLAIQTVISKKECDLILLLLTFLLLDRIDTTNRIQNKKIYKETLFFIVVFWCKVSRI